MKLLPENDPFLTIPLDNIDLDNLPVDFFKDIDILIDVLYKHKAKGLAANQIGLSHRVFLIDSTYGAKCFINQKLLKVGDIKSTTEGCLSFPGLNLVVNRPNFIQIQYYDYSLQLKHEYLDGYDAVCFQHEMDHLNGILFTDKVSNFQKKRAYEKRRKLQTSN